MKHFGIYDSAEDLQDALNAGAIENPYVALVDGDLDYNTMSPEEPSYIGEWSDDGEGNYTFDILESDPALWGNETTIATANLVLEGASTDVEITILYDNDEWRVVFLPIGGEASNPPEYQFSEGTPYTWDTGVMTADDDSDAVVMVDYDGGVGFTFYSGSANNPLSLNTINITGE